jgi:glycosyltransferase involved in cell wall biosynthesis
LVSERRGSGELIHGGGAFLNEVSVFRYEGRKIGLAEVSIEMHVNKKMKILHLIKSLGRGGAETLLPETLKLHDRARFEFHYIYFLPWKNQLVAALQQAGGQVTCLSASNNVWLALQAEAVVRYVCAHGIQLVHCHLPWAGFVGRYVYQRTGVPVIYTEHNKQERYHGITRWLNKVTFNRQSLVVAVSDDVAKSIALNIRPQVPVRTILNGVNTGFFQRSGIGRTEIRHQCGLPAEAVVVGIVSVFRFQKRLVEWLQVFQRAAAAHANLYGVIVGDGPLRAEVEAEIARLGLTGRVVLAGLQTNVKPWYEAMDVFMMTSVFEGLPIALLEAMSMGCAVVTTDAGGIKEVIRNEVDGVMVEVDQWPVLAEHLSRVAGNAALRHEFGRAARARVVAAFSLRRMVGELEGLYGKMVWAGWSPAGPSTEGITSP